MTSHRYERKKNIGLAIQAFQHFKEQLPHHEHHTRSGAHGQTERVLLVVAGGYDLRVDENVEYLEVRCCLLLMCIATQQQCGNMHFSSG